jgi:hypothetical protein
MERMDTTKDSADTRTLRVISTLEVPGQRTGYVVHDERGNATWRIHAPPGASIETSTVVLRRLDTANLSVDGLARRSLGGYDQHGGYNPYDRVGRDYFAR